MANAMYEFSQIPPGACLHYLTQKVQLHYRLQLYRLPKSTLFVFS
jgi:hypothetical protein